MLIYGHDGMLAADAIMAYRGHRNAVQLLAEALCSAVLVNQVTADTIYAGILTLHFAARSIEQAVNQSTLDSAPQRAVTHGDPHRVDCAGSGLCHAQ